MIWTKLKAGALVVVLFGVTILAIQQQQIRRLMAEAAALREQVAQAASLREENQRLTAQLKAAAEGSQTDRGELMRLRAQSSRLRQVEQDNAQLKVERQRLASQVAQNQQAAALAERQQRKPVVSSTDAKDPREVTDLGVVELSDGTPMRFDIGAGKECVVSPKVLGDGTLEIGLLVETKGADGKAVELGRSRITTFAGRQCSISVGDQMIGLTPKLKTE